MRGTFASSWPTVGNLVADKKVADIVSFGTTTALLCGIDVKDIDANIIVAQVG